MRQTDYVQWAMNWLNSAMTGKSRNSRSIRPLYLGQWQRVVSPLNWMIIEPVKGNRGSILCLGQEMYYAFSVAKGHICCSRRDRN